MSDEEIEPTDEPDYLRLSSTQISMFHQCPRKWKFRYIDKLYGEATPAMVTGTFVHSVLENLFKIDKNERTIDSAKVIARTQWDLLVETDEFKAFELDEDAQKKFRVNSWFLIQRLWDLERPQFVNVIDVEMQIEFDVCEGVKLIGFIDRIDEGRYGADIVDYKSGKRPAKWFEKDKVGQIYLYGLGISKLTDFKLGKGKLLFLGGDDPGIVSRNITTEVLEQTEQKLVADALEIVKARETLEILPNVGPLCGWCDYVDRCPEGIDYVIGRMQKGDFREDAPAVDFIKYLSAATETPLPW